MRAVSQPRWLRVDTRSCFDTVEMKTSFVQPGLAGSRLTASGHAVHRSSTLAFCEGEVRVKSGRLIARSMGSFKYIRQRPADQPADGQ